MERNIRLYPWYYAASSFLAWLPVFFLYFNEYLDLKQVLLLEAIYYISVVLLEVPTGYFSDVLGRKITLLIGAFFLTMAIVLFMIGGSFGIFICAQICFAGFMAFVSGTNTVFHYESLKSTGKEGEYGDREASVNKWAMFSGGAAALLGGLIGGYSLKATYGLSLIAALLALVIVLLFKEPKRDKEEGKALQFVSQLGRSFHYLTIKPIGWVFAFYVLLFFMIHVPYEFYQPYLGLLEDQDRLAGTNAPLVSGMLYASSRFISAFVAGQSIKWKRAIGLFPFFIMNFIIILVIVGSMGFVLHPALILVLIFRGAPWAAIKAPLNELITPAIEAGQRATFHSLMSLACRLGFFIALFGLSFLLEEGQTTDWASLSLLLKTCFLMGIVSLGIVWLSWRPEKSTGHNIT